ncbi:MAG: dephospho-CoA kinase [Cytophagales bacterium]|nr:dephospho-CoA kinase [Armatimonadota bacterium]
MKIIGITGGIASGKSTVTKQFADLGASVLSADTDARAVLANGSPLLEKVFARFPETRRADGTLDRTALGARIFADPVAKAELEAITHPAIIARMRSAISMARSSNETGALVYEVPLLYERGLTTLFDVVIAVLATPQLQEERLQAREAAAGRPPLTSKAVADRLAAQMAPEEKARRADYVIRTDVPLIQTEEQVRRMWGTLSA